MKIPGIMVFTVAWLFLQSGVVVAVKLPDGPVDPNGHAREAAMAELAKLGEVGWYGYEDSSVMKRASLGEPFLYFWTDWTFTEFETGQADDMLKYVTHYVICFPVTVDGRILGSINISERNGTFAFNSASIGDSQCVRITQARRMLDLGPGQRLSAFLVATTGNFLIVEDGTAILQMAAISPGAKIQTQAPTADVGLPTFLPVGTFVTTIQRDIREHRRREADPASEIQPLRTLDD